MPWLYLAAYLLLLIPTYILPYLGSNSSLINAVSTAVGMGISPLWWAHAWFLTMLIILAWWRGKWNGKGYLAVFPVLACAFDLVPVLNLIPLVPTVLHIVAMVLGVIGEKVTHEKAVNAGRKAAIAAAIATAIAILGVALYVAGVGRLAAKAKQQNSPSNTGKSQTQVIEAPKEAIKPLDIPGAAKTSEPVQKENASPDVKPAAKEPKENRPEPNAQAESGKPDQAEAKPVAEQSMVEKKKTGKPRTAHKPADSPRKSTDNGGSVRYITIR